MTDNTTSHDEDAFGTLITQGEYAVSDQPDMMISTLLGSCVACCLWDPIAKVGGMNHLLLAGGPAADAAGYHMAGVAEMECLINAMIKLGARRQNLRSKVFGGAQMLKRKGSIGENNADFALRYLEQENIPCEGASVGGTSARAIRFWSATGRVSMKMMNRPADDIAPPPSALVSNPGGNDLELF